MFTSGCVRKTDQACAHGRVWAWTYPSLLVVHVDGADVLGQAGAGGEALQAVVPAAGVGHGLG